MPRRQPRARGVSDFEEDARRRIYEATRLLERMHECARILQRAARRRGMTSAFVLV